MYVNYKNKYITHTQGKYQTIGKYPEMTDNGISTVYTIITNILKDIEECSDRNGRY